MPRGGSRAGAGRPSGARDTSPRLKRADVLSARREDWDKWEQNTGALRKARKRLLDIIEDPDTNAREVLAAVKMLEERGLGRPTEEREPQPQQTLVIVRQAESVFLPAGPETPVIVGEITDEVVQRAFSEPS